MKPRRKTCCHCGRETHPQPQDFQHDKGFGHCAKCLGKEDWYKKTEYQADNLYLFLFHECPGTSDDSHAKVTEVFSREGRCLYHQTRYSAVPEIINGLSKYFGCDFIAHGDL